MLMIEDLGKKNSYDNIKMRYSLEIKLELEQKSNCIQSYKMAWIYVYMFANWLTESYLRLTSSSDSEKESAGVFWLYYQQSSW